MIFYSSEFTFDEIHSSEYNIYLVSEEDGILNEYGISFSLDEESEIVLSFCYATEKGEALEWDEDILTTVSQWFITDGYKPFVSEDNEDVTYFFKGVGLSKRFTKDFRGVIDITFKILSNYGYKKYIKIITNTQNEFSVFNGSSISIPYKPVIEIKNILSETIEIQNLAFGEQSLILKELTTGKDIYIDNKMGVIIDTDGNNLIMKSNRKWIELKKGVNKFRVDGECTLIFKAYYPVIV